MHSLAPGSLLSDKLLEELLKDMNAVIQKAEGVLCLRKQTEND